MIRPLLERLRAIRDVAPRSFWYVWWGTLVNRLGGFVVPLLTIYLTTVRGVAVDEAGGIVSLFGLGQIAASFVGGQLADRVGRRATMALSLFGGAAAMLGLGQARDLTTISVMTCVVGFVGELYRPAVAAFISDVIPPAHRVQAYALLHWVVNVGFAVALILGGLLADVDFTILFVGDAATMAIYGVLVLVAVPETRPAIIETTRTAPSKSWLLDGPFVVFVAICFAMTMMPIQSGATLAAHMTWQGFTPAAYGAIMAVNGILVIALQPMLAVWCARFEPSRVLAVGALLYGFGIALHGVANSIVVHGFAVIVWTLGEIVESPTRTAIVAGMAPADARGRYQGALVTAWGGALFLGPRLGTYLWQDVGPRTPWLGAAALGIATAAALLATGRARSRRIG